MKGNFDFDYWATLYKRNPVQFEEERKKSVNFLIENVKNCSERRMRGLQFRIDLERQRSKTPMGACIRLSRLMMDRFYGEFVPSINKYCGYNDN